MKYDKEENEILEAYGLGKIKLLKPSAKEIEAIKVAAENTFKKDNMKNDPMLFNSMTLKMRELKSTSFL
ncbi:hypothetical protein GMMP15_1870008 [Candidatus Magnetomoraceae bacterium gMMP-15]